MKNTLVFMLLAGLLSSCKTDSTEDTFPYPTDGLISYFGFEDNLKDSQGNTGDGVSNGGPAFVAGAFQKGISFNGTNQKVTFPRKTFRSGNNVSISFWFKKTPDINIEFAMSCLDFNVATSNSNISYVISVPSTNSAAGAFPTATWTHFVGTYNGAEIKTYINGILTETKAHAGNIDGTDVNFEIGYSSQFNNWWAGEIDEVLIYNRALTQADVSLIYSF